MNELIKKISKLTNHKHAKTVSTILLIVVCFFSFNLSNLLGNIFNSIVSIFSNETEVKTVLFTQDGYEEEVDGTFEITKHADWTSTSTSQMTYTVDSIIEKDSVKKDIIIVLDTSASMLTDSRMKEAKVNIKGLISEVLEEDGNKIGLITFNSTATTLSGLTDNETTLLDLVESIEPTGDTNYNQALIKVGEILSTYQETEGREVEVLFITDGYPNIENPNQNSTYEELKAKYPFITVHGIQYEMGTEVVVEIKRISDKQYAVDRYYDSYYLKNVLIEAAFSSEAYETFEIVEYVDNTYFTVGSATDISVSVGTVSLTTEGNTQKIVWSAPNQVITGSTHKMTINLKLKSAYVEKEGLYPTSTKENITLKLPGNSAETFDSTEVTKLKAPYTITYEANAPTGCNTSINLTTSEYAFNAVKFTDQKLSCDGYYFQGWEVVEDVIMINDDYFQMPTEDIIIRGIWSKLQISKSMEGKVYEHLTLYKTIAKQAVADNISSQYVSSSTGINFKSISSNTNGKGVYTIASTLNDTYPVHYFRGAVTNNHVIFGGFCWEIVRTTETGGVKMIYDGVPVDGTCPNTGTASQLSTTSAFNSSYTSPADVGYMYNARYTYSSRSMRSSVTVLTRTNYASTNYYYGASVTYANGTYTLNNPTQYTWESNYSTLSGYYTCGSATNTSCSTVYYVVGSTSTYSYRLGISGGTTIDDYTMTLGTGYTESNGTYTLTGTVTVSKKDWYTDYSKYSKYYMCSDETSTSCGTLQYISSTENYRYYRMNSANNYLYGNSFTYDGTNYTLKDTKQFWKWWENYNTLNNNHYTCFDTDGSCTTIYYVYYTNSTTAYYISLTGGKSVEDALNEMLYDSDVNTTNSTMKTNVDKWYEENMTNYTKYLEDTEWCNDRSTYDLAGWNPNGGSTTSYLYFGAYGRRTNGTPTLECSNNDAFTVNTTNGNGALTYPVGLITADEVMYAGGQNSSNSSYYLYTGQYYWTLAPYNFFNDVALGFYVSSAGRLSSNRVHNTYGVRPAVSLIPDIEYSQGDGTVDNPYVIALP